MKVQREQRNVTTSTEQSATFKIRQEETAKVIGMLISGLYSNKPQSITREIWSNALDAHTQAGTPERPFDVVFPSSFAPVFKVRDYGLGLDHQTIMELYTSVGYSTKEDSNEQVGTLGIGSKAPFSYTDTFSVTTYVDGTARFYTAIIEENHIPAMHLMAETETDRPNGTEISFPVSPDDVEAFRRSAHRVAYGFDVKPRVVAEEGVEDENFSGWLELPVVTEGPDWRLLSGALEGYGGTAYAKMGCVLYPIDPESIEGLSQAGEELLQATLIIDFPIGALNFVPSREALSYGRKEPTSKAITDQINRIVEEIADKICEDYAACPNYFEACKLHRAHMHMDLPRAVKHVVQERAFWCGSKLATTIDLFSGHLHRADFPGINFDKRDHIQRLEFKTFFGSDMRRRKHMKYDYGSSTTNLEPLDDIAIVIEDLGREQKELCKRVPARMTQFRNDTRGDVEQVVWIKYKGSRQEAKDLMHILHLLQGVPVYMADELDLPEPVRGTGGPRSPVMVRNLNSYEYRFMDKMDLDMSEGGFYVKYSRMEPAEDLRYNPYPVRQALTRAGILTSDQHVVAVPKTLWKRFEENDAWQEFPAFAENYWTETDCLPAIADAEAIENTVCDMVMQFLSANVDCAKIGTASDARMAIGFFNKMKETDIGKAKALRDLGSALKKIDDETGLPESDLSVELAYHKELVEQVYPLLHVMARRMDNVDGIVDMVSDYVYMCDAAQESLRNSAAA